MLAAAQLQKLQKTGTDITSIGKSTKAAASAQAKQAPVERAPVIREAPTLDYAERQKIKGSKKYQRTTLTPEDYAYISDTIEGY